MWETKHNTSVSISNMNIFFYSLVTGCITGVKWITLNSINVYMYIFNCQFFCKIENQILVIKTERVPIQKEGKPE